MKYNIQKIAVILLILISSSFSITIKLGSLAPQNSPWDDALRKLSSQWQQISNGTIKIKIYPGGIAGDESDMLRKMKGNMLGASALTSIGMNELYSGIIASSLPMVFDDDKMFNYVFEKMRPKFEAELAKKGVKVIIWTKIGWIRFFAKNPISSPSDLTKEKIFVYSGDGNAVRAWKKAGFNPVPLSTNDVLTSLQSGMISSFATTPLSAAALQWFGLAKNMADMKWAPLMGGVIVSTKIWNKIKPELQTKLLESAKVIGKNMQINIDKADADAIAVMKENGLNISPVSDQQKEEWRAIAKTAISEVIGTTVDKTTYDELLKYVEEYKKIGEK